MRVIRRRIRGFFALQAILLVVTSVLGFTRPQPVANPLRHVALLVAYLVFGVLFAGAWWTTRKPSSCRNLWAVAASLVSLVGGAWILWNMHGSPAAASPGFLIVALGAAGLYLYAQGGAPSTSSSSPAQPRTAPRPAAIAGDRTSPWVNRLFSAVSLVAQFASVYVWTVWARHHGLPRASYIPWYVLYTAAVLTSTIVHECGHAFVAWGCRMQLLSFNAGPLRWRRREGKWGFKFNYEGFFDLGGAVQVVPTNPDQPRGHDIFMIAAGPLANILGGLIAVWAIFHLSWPGYAQTWKLPAYFASFCFIAAITNLLPFRTEDGGYSDGARLLQILTRSPLADYFRTMNALSATLITHRRLRDLDIDAIERAAARFPSQLTGLQLKLSAANVHQDANRLPEARTALAHAEAIYNDHAIDLPAALHTAFVLGHAWLNRDPCAARLWWDRMEAKPAVRQNVDYWLAKSTLLWIERRFPEAEEAWQNAATQARELPEFGAYQFDRARCALLRHELDNPSPAPAAAVAASAVRQLQAKQPQPRPSESADPFRAPTPVRAAGAPSLRPTQPPRSQPSPFDPLAALRPASAAPVAAAVDLAAWPASAPPLADAPPYVEVEPEVTSAAFARPVKPEPSPEYRELPSRSWDVSPLSAPVAAATATALPFRHEWLAATGQATLPQPAPEPVHTASSPVFTRPIPGGLGAPNPAPHLAPEPTSIALRPVANPPQAVAEPRRTSKAPPARVIPATPRLRAESGETPRFDPLQFLRPSAGLEKNPT